MRSISATQLVTLSVAARFQLIQSHASSVSVPDNIYPDLHRAYQISTVLTPALFDFIQHQIHTDIFQESVFLARSGTVVSEVCSLQRYSLADSAAIIHLLPIISPFNSSLFSILQIYCSE